MENLQADQGIDSGPETSFVSHSEQTSQKTGQDAPLPVSFEETLDLMGEDKTVMTEPEPPDFNEVVFTTTPEAERVFVDNHNGRKLKEVIAYYNAKERSDAPSAFRQIIGNPKYAAYVTPETLKAMNAYLESV